MRLTALVVVMVGCSSGMHQPVPLDAAGIASCDQVFAAIYERCGGPRWPDDELVRVQALFEQACRNRALMPGSGITAEALERCAGEISSLDCQMMAVPNGWCDLRGTLDAGARCFDSAQCASGSCSASMSLTPGGPFGPVMCGICAATVGLGDACGDASCPVGAECRIDASGSTYTCQEVQRGVGSCTLATCNTAGAGASCRSDVDCASGLGCIDQTSPHCDVVTWAEPGQACDDTRRCRIGQCGGYGGPRPLSSVCPAVISDGNPCAGGPEALTTCDTFSRCLEGICTPLGRGSCR